MKNKLVNISLTVVVFVLTLGLAEIFMRMKGYKPGDISPVWFNFRPVDTLRLEHFFYTNTDGILVADSSYWARHNIAINQDGFRSPAFANVDSNKKKVLFIGDSFAWGKSAQPITNCFVDLVRRETGLEVINLGIPGADPVQYFMLAHKYIPILKPDVVFVMFFMGNDLMLEDRKVMEGHSFCYATNAGMLFADIDGRYFSTAQQAYNYVSNEKYYLHKPDNLLEQVISKSAVLSRIYALKFRIREKLKYEHAVKESSVTRKYLTGIDSLARIYHAHIKLVLIPEYKEADMDTATYKKRYADLLLNGDIKNDWLLFKNSKSDFNNYPDGHLNNQGHRYYADLIEKYLKENRIAE
jgi:hypothetical protein